MNKVSIENLPEEVADILHRISQGIPSIYPKDGSIFQNREKKLPTQPSGYYREFTVTTPAIDNRGARRLIMGSSGEIYYTDDHYASFWQVEE